ncbi:hypothetical protein GCM10027294_07220 [Marinactinospora endophytica]
MQTIGGNKGSFVGFVKGATVRGERIKGTDALTTGEVGSPHRRAGLVGYVG